MKKLIKLLFGLAVVFFALIIAAAIVLPLVISPNDYKPQIVEAVKQQTGRDLKIDGEIGLSVFPKLGLTLGKTELSNAAGFKEKIFAKVEAINIQVALMPLLDKRVEMDEIVLQGLELNLQRNQQGISNWDDLMGSKPAKQEKTKADMPELAALAIGGLRIEGAQVHWLDEQSGQRYEVDDFNLTSGPLTATEPVEIKLSTGFISGQPKLKGQLEIAMTVQADIEKKRVEIDAFALSLDASGEALPTGKAKIELKAEQLLFDHAAQTMAMKGMVLDALGLNINGSLSGGMSSGAPQMTGRMEIQAFNARELMAALGQSVPDMADDKALTHIAAGFDLLATNQSADLKNLQIKLDDTVIKGRLGVSQFDHPAIRFDLDIDKIDLDRYLPAANEDPVPGQTGGAAAAAPAGGGATLFPVAAMKKLNANGEVRIGEVINRKVKATNIVVKVKAKDGQINMQPSADLYQGKYNADVTVNVKPATPRMNVVAKLSGVQIEPLLKDLQGEAKLAGGTDATININASGNTQAAMKQSLNGNASFSFQDGALIGVNIAKIIREGLAKVKGKPVPPNNEPERTDFAELKGTAKITNGVIDNRDFAMKSPLLRVTGAGKANLVSEQLDYLVKASVVGSLQGQGGDELSALKGVTIPVRITGSFDKPSYKPDLSAVLSDTAKKKVKEKVDKQKEKVEQKLKDKLKNKFKGLF